LKFRDWLRIAEDLFRDGYKLLGVIAPILSVGFTTAKALNLSVGLQQISYAWALMPLLLWVLVAYVRRCLYSYNLEVDIDNAAGREERLAALSKIRQRGVQLRNASPGSSRELGDWHIETEQWIKEAYEVAGLASQTLRARLETLDEMGPAPDRVPEISPEQVRQTEIMSEILRRIGAYLEKNQ
jgi:hypothetical protein